MAFRGQGDAAVRQIASMYYSCPYLHFLCDSYQVHTYSYDTYILVVRCMKQNKDAVWSLVLLLVTGVRADPKYSYSYNILCMYVREDC